MSGYEVMKMLALAIQMAARAHAYETDKANDPYIMHPVRVMLACGSQTDKICAVLHDVIEDTELTLEVLREAGFAEEVLEIVDALSKREEEMYDEYIARLLNNNAACRIKLADLCDNTNLNRIPKPSKKDIRRVEKYTRAAKKIIKHLRASNNGSLGFEIPDGDYGERLKEFINECSK